MYRLSGAINAALREDKGIEAIGDVASGDAAIGQIERRLLETEEGIVAAGGFGDEHGG